MVSSYGVIRVVFAVSRVFQGICAGVFSVGSVLSMAKINFLDKSIIFFLYFYKDIEICGPSKRVTAVNVIHFSYVFGVLVTVGIAYFIRNFDTLSIVYSSLMAFLLIFFW